MLAALQETIQCVVDATAIAFAPSSHYYYLAKGGGWSIMRFTISWSMFNPAVAATSVNARVGVDVSVVIVARAIVVRADIRRPAGILECPASSRTVRRLNRWLPPVRAKRPRSIPGTITRFVTHVQISLLIQITGTPADTRCQQTVDCTQRGWIAVILKAFASDQRYRPPRMRAQEIDARISVYLRSRRGGSWCLRSFWDRHSVEWRPRHSSRKRIHFGDVWGETRSVWFATLLTDVLIDVRIGILFKTMLFVSSRIFPRSSRLIDSWTTALEF